MKDKLKQIGKKYLVPPLIVGALAFGSNAYAKQNSYQELAQNQRNTVQIQKIEQEKNYNIKLRELGDKVEDFKKQKAGLENYIVQRISDGKLSVKENDEIRSYIGGLINERKNIYSLVKEKGLVLSDRQKQSLVLDEGLRKGLEDAFEYSGKKLEKYFAGKGLKVEVNGKYESLKLDLGLALIFLSSLVVGPIFVGLTNHFSYIPTKNQ